MPVNIPPFLRLVKREEKAADGDADTYFTNSCGIFSGSIGDVCTYFTNLKGIFRLFDKTSGLEERRRKL
jgi:hypothetical protein